MDTDSGRTTVVIGEEFREGGTIFDFVGRNHTLCGGSVFSVGFELAREPVFEIITVDEGRKSVDIKDDDWVTIDIAFYTNTFEGGTRTIGGVIGGCTAGSRGAWNDGDERIVSQSGERCESRRERGRREEIRRKVGGYRTQESVLAGDVKRTAVLAIDGGVEGGEMGGIVVVGGDGGGVTGGATLSELSHVVAKGRSAFDEKFPSSDTRKGFAGVVEEDRLGDGRGDSGDDSGGSFGKFILGSRQHDIRVAFDESLLVGSLGNGGIVKGVKNRTRNRTGGGEVVIAVDSDELIGSNLENAIERIGRRFGSEVGRIVFGHDGGKSGGLHG